MKMFPGRKSPYQMERAELIERARALRLPNAKLFGDKNSLNEIFNDNPSLDDLRKQVLEQERWNLERWLWTIALSSAIASIVSAVAAWTAIVYSRAG
jgi:hypothetical protein